MATGSAGTALRARPGGTRCCSPGSVALRGSGPRKLGIRTRCPSGRPRARPGPGGPPSSQPGDNQLSRSAGGLWARTPPHRPGKGSSRLRRARRSRLRPAEGGPLPAAIGLAFDDQFPGRALEPVDGRLGQQRVGQHPQPLARVPIGGQQRGAGFVPFDDNFIKIGSFGGVQGLEGKVVELLRYRSN